jgi:hypothetical protein
MTKMRLTRPAILYATGDAILSNENAMIFCPKWTVPLKINGNVKEVDEAFSNVDEPPKRYRQTIPPPSLYNHSGIMRRNAMPLE